VRRAHRAYRVAFTHPLLESLGAGTDTRVELRPGDSVTVSLALPSARTLLGRFCPGAGAAGAVFGRVRDAASGRPLADATVRVAWDGASGAAERTTRSDESGAYRLCDLPARAGLRLTVGWSAAPGAVGVAYRAPLDLSAVPVAVRDLALDVAP
jgi:hypothetical protein